jgi:hypothetical protein
MQSESIQRKRHPSLRVISIESFGKVIEVDLSSHALIIVSQELQDLGIAPAVTQSHVIGIDRHFPGLGQS